MRTGAGVGRGRGGGQKGRLPTAASTLFLSSCSLPTSRLPDLPNPTPASLLSLRLSGEIEGLETRAGGERPCGLEAGRWVVTVSCAVIRDPHPLHPGLLLLLHLVDLPKTPGNMRLLCNETEETTGPGEGVLG